MPACASIRAAPAARPAISTITTRGRTSDFHDCIEWAAAQPWCSGKVGLNGISYYAASQWRAAALQPPHLAAICVWEGWVELLSRVGAPRRHHLQLPQELAGDAGQDRAARAAASAARRAPSPASWSAGRRRFPKRSWSATAPTCGQDFLSRPLDGPYYRERSGGSVQGHGAAALCGQLGRAGAAHARQLRRLRARGVEAEMAGSARRLALGAVLYRLRREAAEALLRLFPQGREERLGQAAARAAAGAPSRREIRRAARERMAARAHAVDAASISTRRACGSRREPVESAQSVDLRCAWATGVTFSTPPLGQADGDHRARRR